MGLRFFRIVVTFEALFLALCPSRGWAQSAFTGVVTDAGDVPFDVEIRRRLPVTLPLRRYPDLDL
jgi:hypothetical protein